MSFLVSNLRVLFACALFACVLFAPWWIALCIALVLTLRWRAWEVIAAGLLFDFMWLPAFPAFSVGALPLATIIALMLILLLEPLRRQLLVGPALL